MATVQQFLATQGLAFKAGAFQAVGAVDGLTAHAGGGQGSALALTGQVNRVTTVASAGDSVALPTTALVTASPAGPQSLAGVAVTVINSGANALAVFPNGSDAIDGGAGGAAVSLPVGGLTTFYCLTPGAWFTSLGAAYSFAAVTASGMITANGGLTLGAGQLLFESAADNLTAHAGGGQGSALALTAELNRLGTVASAGDSVLLPASAPGLTIIVINHGANPAQVYGAGTDTIDDVATAVGVSQMVGSVTIYACAVAGKWYSEGIGTGYAGSFPTVSYVNGLTAHAGGGQGSATPLTSCINRVTTVASASDSVLLPASSGGMQLTVINAAAANAMNVFPATGETINALAANAALAIAAGKTATFECAVGGAWHALASA